MLGVLLSMCVKYSVILLIVRLVSVTLRNEQKWIPKNQDGWMDRQTDGRDGQDGWIESEIYCQRLAYVIREAELETQEGRV